MAYTLPKRKAMNLFDIFIIYLACGAPFGVYYFVNHRKERKDIILKSVLISLFWIPFAIGLLQKYFTKQLPDAILAKKNFRRDEEILTAKKNLEETFIKNKFEISIFELREIFDRYIGLAESVLNQNETANVDSEFFAIAGNENPALAAKCFQRRNRKLLSFHHTLAGQDLVQTISGFVSMFPSVEEIENASFKLVRLLNDRATEKNLRSVFNKKMQSREVSRVHESEKELWINEPQQPSTANTLRISAIPASATTNSSIKD